MSENLFMKAMSKTASVYWHDSGKLSEIDEAISNGAVSITLNPSLTYSALESDLPMWREKASEISENYSGDKKAEEDEHRAEEDHRQLCRSDYAVSYAHIAAPDIV